MEDLSDRTSHCVCVPSYIVHGLLETVACSEGKGRERRLGAHDQEFHQQMLRKLALHLAAQPGKDFPTGAYPQVYVPPSSSFEKARDRRGQQGKGFFQHDSRPQQEEFHRQMLQKLALHLAAQPDTPSPSPHANQSVAMPSAMGSAEHALTAAEARKAPSSSIPQCHYQSHQSYHPTLQPECHQELLRKLALHLAAQDHPLDKPAQVDSPAPGMSWQPMTNPTDVGEDWPSRKL